MSINQKIQHAVIVPAVSISLHTLVNSKTYLVGAEIYRAPRQKAVVVHFERHNFQPAVTVLYHGGKNQNSL